MLNHLRQHIAATLTPSQVVTLATNGPAGLQVGLFPCAASELLLYVLLPRTSDHLLNLETSPSVVITTADWQVRGRARALAAAEVPAALELLELPEAPWSVVVEVRPGRVAIARREGWGAAETIDLD